METVVILIMLLVGLSFLLKLTLMPVWLRFVECAILAIAAVLATDLAISQSKARIEEWLASPELMLDTAVLLTIDVAMQISFCIISVAGPGRQLKERVLRALLLAVPGLMVFPVVFACLVELVFSFTGTDFYLMGYGFGAFLLLAVPLLGSGMRFLLPDSSQRLELIFYLNCIIGALGVVATVNGRTAATGVNELNLLSLATIVLLALAAAATGYFIFLKKS